VSKGIAANGAGLSAVLIFRDSSARTEAEQTAADAYNVQTKL